MEPTLPDPNMFAALAVAVLFGIVVWDAFWLTRQRLDVPTLGELSNGGFAWESEGAQELIRQWGNLGSMAAMMVLPWGLVGVSNTNPAYAIAWDVCLTLHLISLLIPKRYAVTRTHAFADGQRYDWQRLRLAGRQPARRIMLLRKGWGIFGPLPLGGAQHDLSTARERISLALGDPAQWPSISTPKEEE